MTLSFAPSTWNHSADINLVASNIFNILKPSFIRWLHFKKIYFLMYGFSVAIIEEIDKDAL